MTAEVLLERLTKVKKRSASSWVACCPAHADRSPSLTVREVEDGRVLVHCFGGCDVESVLAAVGLTFEALYPPRAIEHGKPLRRPFPAADVLEAVAGEMLLVATAAAQLRAGKPLCEQDQDRLMLAAERIAAAVALANG